MFYYDYVYKNPVESNAHNQNNGQQLAELQQYLELRLTIVLPKQNM